MMISVDFWQLVGILLTMLAGYAALGKLLLASTTRSINQQFDMLRQAIERVDEQHRVTEKDLRALHERYGLMQTEMYRTFIDRQEFARQQTTVEHKLDSIYKTIVSAGAK
jgi:hypothetical protein